jgi:hypothetical protein
MDNDAVAFRCPDDQRVRALKPVRMQFADLIQVHSHPFAASSHLTCPPKEKGRSGFPKRPKSKPRERD